MPCINYLKLFIQDFGQNAKRWCNWDSNLHHFECVIIFAIYDIGKYFLLLFLLSYLYYLNIYGVNIFNTMSQCSNMIFWALIRKDILRKIYNQHLILSFHNLKCFMRRIRFTSWVLAKNCTVKYYLFWRGARQSGFLTMVSSFAIIVTSLHHFFRLHRLQKSPLASKFVTSNSC